MSLAKESVTQESLAKESLAQKLVSSHKKMRISTTVVDSLQGSLEGAATLESPWCQSLELR